MKCNIMYYINIQYIVCTLYIMFGILTLSAGRSGHRLGILIFSKPSRPAVGSTQPFVQSVWELFSGG